MKDVPFSVARKFCEDYEKDQVINKGKIGVITGTQNTIAGIALVFDYKGQIGYVFDTNILTITE